MTAAASSAENLSTTPDSGVVFLFYSNIYNNNIHKMSQITLAPTCEIWYDTAIRVDYAYSTK